MWGIGQIGLGILSGWNVSGEGCLGGTGLCQAQVQ